MVSKTAGALAQSKAAATNYASGRIVFITMLFRKYTPAALKNSFVKQ